MVPKNFLLPLTFVVLYTLSYFFLELYKSIRVDEILSEQKNYLTLSYNQGIDRFESISHNVALSMQSDRVLTSLVKEVNSSNLELLHKKIYNHLAPEFEKLKTSDVMGIQIATPDGISIVRMHEKEHFGDDLTQSRPMIKSVNEKRVHIHGFEEGKTSHAFREAFPLYYEREYIGVIEVLFSSTRLQDYTMRASSIHTHFIVDKNVFKTNEWKSNSQEPYRQSIEHKDYLFSLNSHMLHDVLEESSRVLIKPLRKEIDAGFTKGETFALYQVVGSEAKVLVFFAVKHFVDAKTVAYLVSYVSVPKLYDLLQTIGFLKVIIFLILLVAFIVLKQLLLQKERTLKELKYDALTTVVSRKYFMDYISEKRDFLKNTERPFCMVMADIDHFKNVNDTFGHQYGDEVLKEFAAILKSSVRHEDIVARYGGEEFLILLRTDIENASLIVETIRKKIENTLFGEDEISITGSFGLTEYTLEEEVNMEELISRADKALYRAKEQGRNQVVRG
ncbi:MAG: diguanylate cyclase [Campylobacterales bacterium]|nr:diguanylate cyclase [Campylobacterales bacterium]